MLARSILYILKPFIFILGFFALNRLIFIVYHADKFTSITVGERLSALWHAVHLDISAASYIMILPVIALLVQAWLPFTFLKYFQRLYYGVLIFLLSVISTVDLPLYEEWGTKLHYKALLYMQHPAEVMASASSSPIFWLILILIAQVAVGWILYQRWAHVVLLLGKLRIVQKLLFLAGFFPAMGLIMVGMRGGFQEIPISQSASYHSSKHILNHTSVNSAWSLIHSLIENWENLDNNPYEQFPAETAEKIVDELHRAAGDSVTYILNHPTPNIVLIIIEGWTADIVEALGGEKDVTPYFGELVEQGLLFEQCYASGMRSDKGIVAMLSGFPSQPATSIATQPAKSEQLPCLSKGLKPAGYSSAFYFGGDLNYGNIKSYLLGQQFEELVEGADFPKSISRASLGVPDEFVLQRLALDLDKKTAPFFTAIYTLSSHEPFDIPEKWQGHFDPKELSHPEAARYLDAVRYADHCLGEFFNKARKSPWYQRTLFVLVSDHSHHWPRNRLIYRPERHLIPMLFFGEALRDEFRGQRFGAPANQSDLPATLLAQLNLPHSHYRWSRNLLKEGTPEFGFYTFIEGYGFVRGSSSFSWENRFQQYTHQDFESPEVGEALLRDGGAYMQEVFRDYLEY